MKKNFSLLSLWRFLVAMSGQAQLTSGNSEKRCDVSYPIADLSVCLTSNCNARIVSKYVTDALISRLDMEYDASNSDYMIKSMEVSVYRYKKRLIRARGQCSTRRADKKLSVCNSFPPTTLCNNSKHR
ncbi:MAG: hypothetical protein L6U16_11145 [Porphyromonadaceae bacterium]|nr:MAG: hypothetical protein L6U16_11145 [Porphyromonadaceae bacterium]